MPNWKYADGDFEVGEAIKSSISPIFFFKHSPRCSISVLAKQRMDQAIQSLNDSIWILVNVLENRSASNELEVLSGIAHESPQLLLFKDGVCVFHASHLDISEEAIPSGL